MIVFQKGLLRFFKGDDHNNNNTRFYLKILLSSPTGQGATNSLSHSHSPGLATLGPGAGLLKELG